MFFAFFLSLAIVFLSSLSLFLVLYSSFLSITLIAREKKIEQQRQNLIIKRRAIEKQQTKY